MILAKEPFWISRRPFFLLVAILVHLLAFWLLSRIRLEPEKSVVDEQAQFFRVMVRPPTPPPQIPDSLARNVSLPAVSFNPMPAVVEAKPIVMTLSASFNLELPKIPGLGEHLSLPARDDRGVAGNGQSPGVDSGEDDEITGFHIPKTEQLVAVTDAGVETEGLNQFRWDDRTVTAPVVTMAKTQLQRNFPEVPVQLCAAGGNSRTDGVVIEHASDIRCLVNDTYLGIEQAIGKHPKTSAVYLLVLHGSGYDAVATQDMVSTLRAMQIRLYLCDVWAPNRRASFLPDALIEYARESGGYVHMSSDDLSLKRPVP